jgi:hypothetical protein
MAAIISMQSMAVKNKWFRAWTQAWFYCKVPLIRILGPG